MNFLKNFVYEDIRSYKYFMTVHELQNYKKIKLKYGLLFVAIGLLFQFALSTYSFIFCVLFFIVGFKFPYLLLKAKHAKNCNDVIAAIPLWMNHLYALIEKNTIHNAIVNSLSSHTPNAIKKDLEVFIALIEEQPSSKDAYYQFLSRYQIEGFFDIMMKLYEFRNLSKDKLKYEIRNLNSNLQMIETLKRQNQFKNEMFLGDTCTCFILFIPCIYMTVISLMPSLFE